MYYMYINISQNLTKMIILKIFIETLKPVYKFLAMYIKTSCLFLTLLLQSEIIISKVVSLNPAHGKVYSIQLYVIKFVSNLLQIM
jgi:hypothetical protein